MEKSTRIQKIAETVYSPQKVSPKASAALTIHFIGGVTFEACRYFGTLRFDSSSVKCC
jgi:hypothetical protein